MRAKRADLTRRIQGQLTLRYETEGLTAFAGLSLFQDYVATLKVRARIVNTLRAHLPAIDIGIARAVLLLVALILTGGRRIRHLDYLQHDPIVRQFCGARRLPTSRTINRWLARFDGGAVSALQRVVEQLVADDLNAMGDRRITIDVDGSVVSTGMAVEGAKRGFNPHHRKVPSYYPITAYEARSGRILRVENRPGNIHDGKAALGFLAALFDQVDRTLPWVRTTELRMDGAFFLRETFDLLDQHRAEYAIKVPFWKGLELQDAIRDAAHWLPVEEGVEYIRHHLHVRGWGRTLQVVIFRKRVFHSTAKNFQLDLFDPDNGYHEYSAIASNLAMSGASLWNFMCGRGTHEKVYGELKRGFAFNCLPSMKYHGNSAWQMLSVLSFNLMRGFQVATDAAPRKTDGKRRARHVFDAIHTARFTWLNRPGLVVRPQGRCTLDIGTFPAVRSKFEALRQGLDEHRRFMSN